MRCHLFPGQIVKRAVLSWLLWVHRGKTVLGTDQSGLPPPTTVAARLPGVGPPGSSEALPLWGECSTGRVDSLKERAPPPQG